MENKLLILIQSRTGSSRFPGKSMAEIDNKGLLAHLLENLLFFFSNEQICVLTSSNPENHPIIECCEKYNIGVELGDEDNVASRFNSILLDRSNFDFFFRICGDSPFFSPYLIKESLKFIKKDPSLDLVTSMPNKGNPQGQNIELIKRTTFLKNYKLFKDQDDYEHVTRFFYKNLIKFNYVLVGTKHVNYDYNKFKFSVDTVEDLAEMKKIYSKMVMKPYLHTVDDLINLKLEF